MTLAPFALRGHNPDVLTCIANLSNDEVFTPPGFANQMLDTLAAAWADTNDGADIWANPDVTFLDPFTKSGVFLREITRRLTDGLIQTIPDLAERVDHILTHQVFGIGITELTSLLSRRSVYCSKFANGPHSIAKSFTTDDGNIWFERTEHTWGGGKREFRVDPLTSGEITVYTNRKCVYCRASEESYSRGDDLETHAYAFIHTDDIKARIAELFGDNMQFDVIIGNPPYQLSGGAGGTSDSSIYHLFVQQAIRLEPRFLSMVIPSRWLAGGRGLSGFREQMLSGGHIRRFTDYTKMSTAFPGVDFEGGVGHFLWDRDATGTCEYSLVLGDEALSPVERDLGAHDIFVRDSRALGILDKVLSHDETSMRDLVSGDTPFGLATNFTRFASEQSQGTLEVHASVRQKRVVGYMADSIKKNRELISAWKLFVPKAYGERGAIPANVLGPSILAGPGSVCTQTYVAIGPFDSETEAANCQKYLGTRTARFMISLRKITQDLPRSVYSWLPQQDWTIEWTDTLLGEKYKLNRDEVSFVQSMIRPMGDRHDE